MLFFNSTVVYSAKLKICSFHTLNTIQEPIKTIIISIRG